jgi:hypothetical protein
MSQSASAVGGGVDRRMLGLGESGRQVLGPDLNCSEMRLSNDINGFTDADSGLFARFLQSRSGLHRYRRRAYSVAARTIPTDADA